MAIPVRVLVRTDIAWERMDRQQFEQQKDPTRPLGFIRLAQRQRVLERFHEAFGIDFFRFRAAMKAIGTTSLEQVRGARVTLGFEQFDEWFDDPEDELVFPIDDDDVFHPELASLAERLTPETALVLWRHTTLRHSPPRSPAPRQASPAVLMSNNWGVRKSFLRARLSQREARRFLADHGEAHRKMLEFHGRSAGPDDGPMERFHSGLEGPEVLWLDQCFSLQVLHPASLTHFFVEALSGQRMEDLDIGHIEPLPAALDWARPFVSRYEALTREVLSTRAIGRPNHHA